MESFMLGFVCRTCLKTNRIRCSVFECSKNSKVISDAIMELTSIKITKGDGFPINICNPCYNKLNSAYEFKQMVIESNRKLLEFVQANIENEKELNISANTVSNVQGQSVKSEERELSPCLKNSNDQNKTEDLEINDYDDTLIKLENLTEEVDLLEDCKSPILIDGKNEAVPELQPCPSFIVTHDMTQTDKPIDCQNQNPMMIKNIKQIELNVNKKQNSKEYNNLNKKQLTPLDNSDCKKICDPQRSPSEMSFGSNNADDCLDCNCHDEQMILADKDVTQIELSQCTKKSSRKNLTDLAIVKSELDQVKPDITSNVDDMNDQMRITLKNMKSKRCPEKMGNRKYDTFNLEQLKLLDNPDCKRIMESKLSRKEKTRSKVFCTECNRTLTFRYYVEKHIHTHTGNLPFKCTYCNLGFPKEYHLKKHLQIHSQTKEFTCEECGKGFTTMQILRSHMAIHSNARPYKCDICDKAFKLKGALCSHKLFHKNKEFVCEDCGKSYFYKRDLISHQVLHAKGKKIPCEICGRLITSKKALYSHMKTHTQNGVRPYACTVCNKRFSKRQILNHHVLIHTGAKPHACTVCDKRFRQLTVLRGHMRTHTGETPFSCGLCAASFKYKHHLKNHMKKHDREIVVRDESEDSTA